MATWFDNQRFYELILFADVAELSLKLKNWQLKMKYIISDASPVTDVQELWIHWLCLLHQMVKSIARYILSRSHFISQKMINLNNVLHYYPINSFPKRYATKLYMPTNGRNISKTWQWSWLKTMPRMVAEDAVERYWLNNSINGKSSLLC